MRRHIAKISIDVACEMAKNHDYMVLDDHMSDGGRHKIVGIGQLESGELFAMFQSRYYNINRLYCIEGDDDLHISQCSIAGVIKPMDTGMNQDRAIKKYNDAIDEYRKEMDEMFPESAPHRNSQKIVTWKLFGVPDSFAAHITKILGDIEIRMFNELSGLSKTVFDDRIEYHTNAGWVSVVDLREGNHFSIGVVDKIVDEAVPSGAAYSTMTRAIEGFKASIKRVFDFDAK